jgi:hypothetical protein
MNSTICIAEDRETFEPSIKLLLFTLNKYSPEAVISLFYPPANGRFLDWVKKFPQVRLQKDSLKNGYGWNVKPQAIMQLLDDGFDEVIWIDSDIIVNRDVVPLFSGLTSSDFVATEHTLAEEREDGNALRARLWGLPAGRALPFALSSGVVRATTEHYPMIARWWQLLQTNKYQEAQQLKWKERPIHMLGDQDVLTAVLTSKEFAQVPIRILYRGKHAIQFDGVYGYTVSERIRNLLGNGPVLIHSGASKPWTVAWNQTGSSTLRDYIKMVYLDLSPYTIAALGMRNELGGDTGWMDSHYRLSFIQRVFGFGNPALTGLPMAFLADLVRVIKYIIRRPNLPPEGSSDQRPSGE